ncbi:MAG: hypothetical protein ACJ73S_25830 [Mycobacteriales bacterium]|jgi:hypothetical protein
MNRTCRSAARRVLAVTAAAVLVPLGLAVTGTSTPALAGCTRTYVSTGSSACPTSNGYAAVIASQITLTGDTGQSHPGSVPTGVVPYVPCFYEQGDSGADFKKLHDGWPNNLPSGIRNDPDNTKARWPPQSEIDQHANDTGGSWWYKTCSYSLDDPISVDDFNRASDQFFNLGFDDVWVPNGQPPPGLPAIPPAVLAQFAYAAMGLRKPDLAFSPAGRGVVRLETWLWGQNDAFKTLSVTATYNPTGAWATVTAVPDLRVNATPGGPSTECAAPVPATQADASTGSCGLTFTEPRVDYTVHAVDQYAATWRGSDGNGGQLPAEQTQQDYPYEVDQIQSVNGN